MDKIYKLSDIRNAEVKFKWQMLCLQCGKYDIYPKVVQFLTTAGRMKFVRPLYRSLKSTDKGKALAIKTFLDNKSFYHPICATMVAKDLGL
jgi:hypothetical protein